MEKNMKSHGKVLENEKREHTYNIMEEMRLGSFKKIKLNKNSKLPIKDVKWNEPKNQHTLINMDKYNCGIPTGSKNNLFVVDVDAKDDGLTEWNKHVEQHGEPQTLKISTPSGGYHYYFKHSTGDATLDAVVANITNKSKFRGGKGIDVRTNGGYVVAPPSTTHIGSYKIVKDVDMSAVPMSLITWLCS